MQRAFRTLTLVLLATAAATAGAACEDQTADSLPDGGDDTPSADASADRKTGGEDSGGEDATSNVDAAPTCSGEYVAPDLQGPGPCGTNGFGQPAATFGPVDPNAGATYEGTDLADGIYDAVRAERLSDAGGSYRETFVVKGNRFTRMREIDTGSGNGPGPTSYRAGTFQYVQGEGGGPSIKLSYDCSQIGDASAPNGEDNFPSDAVVEADCSARYRYGVTGIRITLRRR